MPGHEGEELGPGGARELPIVEEARSPEEAPERGVEKPGEAREGVGYQGMGAVVEPHKLDMLHKTMDRRPLAPDYSSHRGAAGAV